MTSATTFLSDPRRRNLAVLAAIALVLVIAAFFALSAQEAQLAPRYTPHEFFPGLAGEVRQVAHIRIQSRANGIIDVVLKPEKGLALPSHGDYHASFEQWQHTLVGLASLQALEPKTARPEWYSAIGVQAPNHGGNGVRITAFDDKGHVMADLIAGKSVDIGDPSGSVGLFVRRPGEAQSWLAQSYFEPKSNPADWLDKTVMDIDRSRIRETDVEPASGPSFSVKRDKLNQPDFTLAELPRGRELAFPNATDGIAAAATDFSFDDVKPAKDLNFSGAAHIVTHTFDGLNVAIDVIKVNGVYWAQISAQAAKPAAEKEAREINAHASGWAYKLAAYKGQQFMTTLDSLLKPLAAPAAPKK